MENYAEKNSSSTEKSNGNYAAGQGNPLYDMFVTQLSQLHTVCAKEALARGFGQANLVRSIGEIRLSVRDSLIPFLLAVKPTLPTDINILIP